MSYVGQKYKRHKIFVPKNKTIFTEADIAFIKEHHSFYTNEQLWNLLNQGKEKPVGFTVFRNLCRSLQLMHTKAPIGWTKFQTDYLLNNWQLLGDVEIAENLNKIRHPGQEFTRKNVCKKRLLLNLHRSPEEIAIIIERNIRNNRYNTSWVNSKENRADDDSQEAMATEVKRVKRELSISLDPEEVKNNQRMRIKNKVVTRKTFTKDCKMVKAGNGTWVMIKPGVDENKFMKRLSESIIK